MKFRNIFFLLSLIFIFGCDQYVTKDTKKINFKTAKKYKNTGFTLLYNDDLDLKKLDQRSLEIFHQRLKAKSQVKITNPINNKSLIAKIKSNKVKFSNFYNSIITNRIVEELDIDPSEPYIEIVLITKDSTFIANKAKTFEEERTVAEKAPVDDITIKSIGISSNKEKSKSKINEFSYIIKIADLYFLNSAELLKKKIKKDTNVKKINIEKLTKTKYRVYLGPFKDIKALKKSFNNLSDLKFEYLEILKL